MNGERETGVTTFFLEEKVDTGNIILQKSLEIGPEDIAGEVHDRLALLGARSFSKLSGSSIPGKAGAAAQSGSAATPAPKIYKEDCKSIAIARLRMFTIYLRCFAATRGIYTPVGKGDEDLSFAVRDPSTAIPVWCWRRETY